jgi:hypothetical protein
VIHRLRVAVGERQELDEGQRQTVAGLMAELDRATYQTTEGLKAWQQAVAPDSKASRFSDTVRVTEETCAAIGEFLGEFGIDDPGRPYRQKTVGAWKTEDFAEGPEITKMWEVTDHIAGPGTYRTEFVYRRGWYGLGIHRASLVRAPADRPEEHTVVATDEHEGTAAHRNVENVYEFDAPEQTGEWRYFIVADIRGMPRESPPDKQGCEGEVVMWKVRDDK